MSGVQVRGRLDDEEFSKAIAETFVVGSSAKEMAETFSCSTRTIYSWLRDPRVQAHARRMVVERVNRITRKIDGEIEARLASVDEMDTELLLKVRKEFLANPLKVGAGLDGGDAGSATNEISEAMDADPDFAEKLRELVKGTAKED